MSSIKSVIEKHALSFQKKEIKRFNEAVAKLIDTELTRREKEGNWDYKFLIELLPTPGNTYLVSFKGANDPTAHDIATTAFDTSLPISVFRNVFVEAYGRESMLFSNEYHCNAFYYSFNFVDIANK